MRCLKIEPVIVVPEQKGISKLIKKIKETPFQADVMSLYYISLYPNLEIPEKNKNNLVEKVAGIVKEAESFILRPKEVGCRNNKIVVYFKESQEIIEIHAKVITILSRFREDHVAEKFREEDYVQAFSEEKQRNIRNYGSPDVMDLYHPYFTVCEMENSKEAVEVSSKFKIKMKNFSLKNIGVYNIGQQEIIKEFKV